MGVVKQKLAAIVRPVGLPRDRISTFFYKLRIMSTPEKSISSEDIMGQKVSSPI